MTLLMLWFVGPHVVAIGLAILAIIRRRRERRRAALFVRVGLPLVRDSGICVPPLRINRPYAKESA